MDQDPAIFVSDLQDVNKNFFEMILSNKSHYLGVFFSPESHLIGFCKSYKMKNTLGKERKQFRQAGVGQVSCK